MRRMELEMRVDTESLSALSSSITRLQHSTLPFTWVALWTVLDAHLLKLGFRPPNQPDSGGESESEDINVYASRSTRISSTQFVNANREAIAAALDIDPSEVEQFFE